MLHLIPYQLFVELISAKGYAGFMAEITDVSARAFRPSYGGPRSLAGQQKAVANMRKWFHATLAAKEFPDEIIVPWLDDVFDVSEPHRYAEAFVRGLAGPDPVFDLTETVALARRIDEISFDAATAFQTGDLAARKSHVLNDERLLAFNRPSLTLGRRANREELLEHIRNASDMAQLMQAWHVFTENALMALFAQLDAEFTAQYFSVFEQASSFRFVTPKLSPRVGEPINGKYQMPHDWYRSPVRRLLDLVACLAHRFEHGSFPARVPTMTALADRVLRDDDEASLTRRLTRWRRGEVPMTFQDFNQLWDTLNESFVEEGRDLNAMAPYPMAMAALAWQKLYVNLGRSKSGHIILIEDDYQAWWSESVKPIVDESLTEPWPECFDRI